MLFPVAQIFRNSHAFWLGRIKQAPEFAEIMREQLTQRLHWLDRELGTRRYLAGDAFSIADQTLLAAIDFAKVSSVRLGDDTRNLKRWHAEVSERPSSRA